MTFLELVGGIYIGVNNEEHELFLKVKEHSPMPKKTLSERENEVARRMVSKGVLKRIKIDNVIHYTVCLTDTVWGI